MVPNSFSGICGLPHGRHSAHMSIFPGTLSPTGTSSTNDVHSLNPSMQIVTGWSMWMGPSFGAIMNLITLHQVLVPTLHSWDRWSPMSTWA